MDITDVRIQQLHDEERRGKTRALVSFVLDDMFAVHEVRVMEGANGLFVAMPSRKGSDGDYRDIAHPVTAEFRKKLSETVLAAYQDVQQ